MARFNLTNLWWVVVQPLLPTKVGGSGWMTAECWTRYSGNCARVQLAPTIRRYGAYTACASRFRPGISCEF